MSEVGLDLDEGDGRRTRRRRLRPGCIAGLVVLVAVCVAAFIGVSKGVDALEEWLGPPDDYTGQGEGTVRVEVEEGDSIASIGQSLESQDVVASVDAFTGVAQGDQRAQSIQPGYYELRKKMSAERALRELLDTDNRVHGKVTVPEGARIDQVVQAITKNTDISRKEVTSALNKPGRLGLPKAAGGKPEGYLFPATYQVEPDTGAVQLLRQMVNKSIEVEREMNIGKRAKALGITRSQAVTVASIIEYEARRDQDLPKVARVIYNRLDKGIKLQMDSTVSYVSKRDDGPWTTKSERSMKSKYNTYRHKGLPPGPIGSPGKKTLRAALNPANGKWLYFVTTNFETGKTEFTNSYKEHIKNVKKSKKYCRESDLC